MHRHKSDIQHKRMTEKALPSLMFQIGGPSSIAMVVTAFYSLADAMFVSKLGTDASAAVGVSFAIQATVQAVAYTLGVGAGSLLSRALGERDKENASKYARVALLLSIITGCIIGFIGLASGKALIRVLGATDAILDPSMQYSHYLLLSAPFMCASFVSSQLLRAEGKALYSMFGLLTGSVLNIILDPILIYRFQLGIAGASIATLISQIISSLFLMSAYFLGYSEIQLLFGASFSDFSQIGRILVSGLPSSARQGFSALATVFLNHAAAVWGESAIAAISVVTRLFLLAFAFCLGIGQGMMPIAGYNYGYKRYDRVRKAFLYAIFSSSLLMIFLSLPFLFYAPSLIAFFRNDPEVIKIGAPALRATGIILPFHGTITCITMLMQAIGNQAKATFLACGRQGFFFFPLLFLLPRFFRFEGLILVQPISDVLTFLLCIPFVFQILRHLKEKMPH